MTAKAMLYRAARSAAYATPLHRWLGLGKINLDGAFWDKKLANEWRPYLGGTISVETRNAIVLALLSRLAPSARTILDVGCASGSLARAPGAEAYRYTGVDISEVAVTEARKLSPGAEFHASRLEAYAPERAYDVIVFNEVLYYLAPEDASREVARYARNLGPDGVLIVSMKNDYKSAAIFRVIGKQLSWVNGILYQEKNASPDFTVRVNRERPASLIGVFSGNSPTSTS